MHFPKLLLVVLSVSVAAACRRDAPRNPVQAAFAQRPASRVEPPVAFRFPEKAGGVVRVYRLPRLEEAAFRFNTPGLSAAKVLGYSEEDDQIYLVTTKGTLVGLDLGTGRSRTLDSGVAAAIAGPTGTPFVVHTDGTVSMVEHRVPVRWAATLAEQPASLVGAGRGTLMVEMRSPGKRQLLQLASGRPTVTQEIPDGQIAASHWGDFVVIATDSGLVTVHPSKTQKPTFIAMKARPQTLALSPSTHRLYAGEGNNLVIFDRFRGVEVARQTLPGGIADIRPDAFGRYLLVRPAAGDSVWIIDISTNRYAATIRGTWGSDLPTVAANGSIVNRLGNDVSVVSGDSLTTSGRVRGSGEDRWMALAWDPRRPALQLAEEAASPSAVASGDVLFVQVSVSQNETWAQDLADNLKRSGLNATVLGPRLPEEGYRVVLGPYPTREAADDAGRKLGKPFYVFTRGEAPAP